MSNQEAYWYWLRTEPKLVQRTLALLEAGETPRDVLGAMTIYGATERLLRLTRQALMFIIERSKERKPDA